MAQMFGDGTNAKAVTRYTQMQLQTSAQGIPLPLLWGAQRLAVNLVWYGNFQSKPVSAKSQKGGKGGAKGGTQYTYSAALILGLCEGPLTDMHVHFPHQYPNADTFIGQVWVDQAQQTTLAALGLTPVQGTVGQSAWNYLQLNFPSQALGYSSLAYLASDDYNLGYSPSIPDHGFECFGTFCGSYTYEAEAFALSGTPQGLTSGAIYSSNGQQFRYVGVFNSQHVFVPASTSGLPGSGTLTLVSGTGPATMNYTAAATANPPVLDANPADIVSDFLTNTQYSIGLSSEQIDATSLDLYRQYCAAQGIFISPLLTNQEQISQTLDRWAQITNTWIFWSGGTLKFVPLGDGIVTNTGITPAVTYTPNVAVIYDLTYDDFIDGGQKGSGQKGSAGGTGNGPIQVTRIDPADAPNHVKLEIMDRANAYNSAIVEWQDQGLVDQFGQVDASVTEAHEICDLGIAAICSQLVGQRLAYIRNTYAFALGYEFSLLEPGDIVSLTDPHLGLDRFPVRIRTIDEDDKGNLAIVAEEFPGGLGTVVPSAAQTSSGGSYDVYENPGSVNPPAVFEPDSALTNGIAQLWILASGGPQWGGCAVMVSFDGSNYTQAGIISTGSLQGVTTADLPTFTGVNPDVTDALSIDTSQCAASMPTSATDADAQAYRTLSLLLPAFATTIPNSGELIAYGSVSPTGTYTDTLSYLERGLYGMEAADHPNGSFFTRIPLGQTGVNAEPILIYDIPPQYIGRTIYLKFLSFNVFANAVQDIGDATDVVEYIYTTTGRGYGSGTAGVPSTPTGLAATPAPNGAVLSWAANPAADNVKDYVVYAAPGSSQPFGAAMAIATVDALTAAIGNLPANAPYTFFLEANNAVGSSAPTAGLNATTLPPAASNGERITATASPLQLPNNGLVYFDITSTTGAALEIDLPASPAAGQRIVVTDEGGNAGTYNWTIRASSGGTIIDTISANNGFSAVRFNGTNWLRTS